MSHTMHLSAAAGELLLSWICLLLAIRSVSKSQKEESQ